MMACESWSPWFYLLGTLQLEPHECYSQLDCPCVQHSAYQMVVKHWLPWSDFPIHESLIHQSKPIVILLSGPSHALEHFSADMLPLYHILLWSSSATFTFSLILEYQLKLSHSEAGRGGFWMVGGVFSQIAPFRRPLGCQPGHQNRSLNEHLASR